MPRLKAIDCSWCCAWHVATACARDIACPACRSRPGVRCKRPSGHNLWGNTIHVERMRAAGAPPLQWEDFASWRAANDWRPPPEQLGLL